MAELFSQMRSKISEFFGGSEPAEMSQGEQEYVELDTASGESKGKVTVRPFVIENFEDIKEILDSLREGNSIALINIKPLREKDKIELKRAISKLQKTTDALSGDIAGFGEDYIVATPGFARIHRARPKQAPQAAEPASQASLTEQDMG